MIKSVLVASEFKEQARSLQARLRELGISVSLQQAYEGLSASYGARNWHTLNNEVLEKSKPPKLKHKIHLFMDFWSSDEYLELPEFAYLDLSNPKTLSELWRTRHLCLSGSTSEASSPTVSLGYIANNVRSKYEDCLVDRESFWFTSETGFDDLTAKTNSIYFDEVEHIIKTGKLTDSMGVGERFSLVEVESKRGEKYLFLFWSNSNAKMLKHLVAKALPCTNLVNFFDLDEMLKILNS